MIDTLVPMVLGFLLAALLGVAPALLEPPDDRGGPVGYMAPQDWSRTLDLTKRYQDVTTDRPATVLYSNDLVER